MTFTIYDLRFTRCLWFLLVAALFMGRVGFGQEKPYRPTSFTDDLVKNSPDAATARTKLGVSGGGGGGGGGTTLTNLTSGYVPVANSATTVTNSLILISANTNTLFPGNNASFSVTVSNNLAMQNLTGSRLLVSDGASPPHPTNSAVTAVEAGYLAGVTSALQTQMDAKAPMASPVFTGTPTIPSFRITQRVATLTDSATVTPATDSFDGGILTTLSQATQFINPTGTPTEFQIYTFRVKSTSARALTWDTQYRGSVDLPLPTTTSGGSKTDFFKIQWNVADSKWDMVGKNAGF